MLFRSRLSVPLELQSQTLKLLHIGYPGIIQMQQHYHLYYFWPGGSSSIKQFCEECRPCRSSSSAKPQEPVPSSTIPPPEEPWMELSLDITSPFTNTPHAQRFIIILQDYFSKYPVVLLTNKTESSVIIKWMKKVFSLFGNPLKIQSNNGPQFTSSEFKDFLDSRNIAHDFSPPYTPQQNGLVEAFNKYLK